jgi:ribosome-associated toxin RatA of RatAB toxin-antitoxin module
VGLELAERSVEIAAPAHACFGAVLEFESYPRWQSAVVDCRVLEHDEQGRGTLVETVVDARVRKVRYVLAYSYEPHERISWELVEGDPKSVEGDYVFAERGGVTVATYRLAVDIGRFGRLVPGDVKRRATEHLMASTVEELRERVEGRDGA